MTDDTAPHLAIRIFEAQARFAVAISNLSPKSSLLLFGRHRLFEPSAALSTHGRRGIPVDEMTW
jgi:hypothetical protein